MKKYILFLLFNVLFLSACASGLLDELISKNAKPYEFTIAENYQRVYKNVSTQAKKCWETGFLLSPQARSVIDAELYSDLGEGDVSWRMVNFGNSFYATAKIKKISSQKTNVKVWHDMKTWEFIGPSVENWAHGNTSCAK